MLGSVDITSSMSIIALHLNCVKHGMLRPADDVLQGPLPMCAIEQC